jgi:hypothetical protein
MSGEGGYEDNRSSAVRKLSSMLPSNRFVVTADRIVIPARSSGEFQIAATFYANKWILSFDNWHDDFDDIESVLRLISQALSGSLRLRIDRIGGRPVRWTLERNTKDDSWIELYSNGVFFIEFGRHKDSIYRRINAPVSASEPSYTIK